MDPLSRYRIVRAGAARRMSRYFLIEFGQSSNHYQQRKDRKMIQSLCDRTILRQQSSLP